MRTLFTMFIIMHGLLHLPAFFRAYNDERIPGNERARRKALLWLTACLLFVAASILYYQNRPFWWVVCLLSIFLSQFLIIGNWKMTKGGTVINFIILLFTIAIGCSEIRFVRDSRELIIEEFTDKS